MKEIPVQIGPSGFFAIRRIAKPMTQFQVLGERASGTNLLRKTIEKNLDIPRTEGLGWKHGFPHMVAIPEQFLIICIVRNAVDWVKSMYARPWHVHPQLQALDYSGFIRHEWASVVDRPEDFELTHPELSVKGAVLQLDRHPVTGLAFDTIFAMRSAKLRALAGMANRGRNCVFIRLEDFNADPDAVMRRLSEAFDIPRSKPFFKPVKRRLGTRFSASIAERAPLPDVIPEADKAFLLANLDTELEARFGYSYT
ncbi:hypothetical protein [Pacificoceanicola onchidii]|uniref:hypothetical protein n=1 Tax=Pacificoceanicola onchidii TaxID=2562685 RepID=UPI0010A661E5|nr:hypothetical protein [Pacificoceanicola onchidii]